MKTIKTNISYFAEASMKDEALGNTGFGNYTGLFWNDVDNNSIKGCEKAIREFKKSCKDMGDKALYKFRIVKKVEKSYLVKNVK